MRIFDIYYCQYLKEKIHQNKNLSISYDLQQTPTSIATSLYCIFVSIVYYVCVHSA